MAQKKTWMAGSSPAMTIWSCLGGEAGGDSVEVAGPHIPICRNPDALRVVAERLAR
jgi:hypothetical protein